MPLRFDDYFSNRVLAVTSDRSVDFRWESKKFLLNEEQRAFLASARGERGADPVPLSQVHGDNVIVVENDGAFAAGAVPEADAALTQAPGVALAVRTADCLPVFLFDPRHEAIGLVHAGWKGTLLNITAKVVEMMEERFGSRPADLRAVFGPSIHPCCYAVGRDFLEKFPGEARARDGQTFFDLPGANQHQLKRAGVPAESVHDCGVCTCCAREYFSYRREGASAGRLLSLMMIRPQAHS